MILGILGSINASYLEWGLLPEENNDAVRLDCLFTVGKLSKLDDRMRELV